MIAVINQKGGVGKTTTSINVAHALSLAGNKVLLMDMDPQGHLSTSVGLRQNNMSGMDVVLRGESSIEEVKHEVRENLFLVPCGEKLGELEFVSDADPQRGYRLKMAIDTIEANYDFVIVDCPPSSGLLGMNTLLAAKELLIPVSSDFLALQGLARLMSIVNHIEGALNIETRKWLVVTRYQSRRKLAREVLGKLQQHFPGRILRTPIRENVALAESPGFGKTIFDYKKLSNGAKDYLGLAADLVNERVMS